MDSIGIYGFHWIIPIKFVDINRNSGKMYYDWLLGPWFFFSELYATPTMIWKWIQLAIIELSVSISIIQISRIRNKLPSFISTHIILNLIRSSLTAFPFLVGIISKRTRKKIARMNFYRFLLLLLLLALFSPIRYSDGFVTEWTMF